MTLEGGEELFGHTVLLAAGVRIGELCAPDGVNLPSGR